MDLAKETYQPPYELLHIYHITGPFQIESVSKPDEFVGHWIEAEDSFLFFEKKADDMVHEWVSKSPSATLEGTFEMTYMDWLGGNFSFFSAGLFTVIPAWKNSKELIQDCAYPIVMDPGVVFGAGTHTTTHNSLEAIDMLYYLDTPETILDIGSGTGILGIAALLRGGKQATLVDNNPLCSQTAKRNVLLNNLADRVEIRTEDARIAAAKKVDVLIANIHYDVLQHLLTPEILRCKKWAVLSGILSSEAEKVIETLSGLPVEILRHWHTDGVWHTFLVAVFPHLFAKENLS